MDFSSIVKNKGRLTNTDIQNIFLKDMGIQRFSETTVYNKGSRIVIYHNSFRRYYIYECKENDVSGVFNIDKWKEVEFTGIFNNATSFTDTRKVPKKIGGILAGRSFYNEPIGEVLRELIYDYSPPYISYVGNDTVFDDSRVTGQLTIPVAIYSTLNRILAVELLIDEKVVYSINNPVDGVYEIPLKSLSNVNGDKTIMYRVKDEGDRINEGILTEIVFTKPSYIGFCEDITDDNLLASLEKQYLYPNNDIIMHKTDTTSNRFVMILHENIWNDIVSCTDKNGLNILDSLGFSTIDIYGQRYKMIYSYKTCLDDVKLEFKFRSNEEVVS